MERTTLVWRGSPHSVVVHTCTHLEDRDVQRFHDRIVAQERQQIESLKPVLAAHGY